MGVIITLGEFMFNSMCGLLPDLYLRYSLVQTLRSAIQLLHYLAFGSDSAPNIRERLSYAPRGPFNGLVHLFIVAFGRLSFSDPPEYLDKACSNAIREVRGRWDSFPGWGVI